MSAYYNEIEPFAAQWLRNLIAAGHIPAGDVDERSIADVQPDDLKGYVQAHFFAGIGGWAYAARLAGFPDDRELWTGSCPCQPFSVAGAGRGHADERHLWPEFFRLISARRPAVVMGEQVAAAVGKDWLDGVSADLEGVGYTCRAAVVPACAVDAPHRRDRLWFVADADRPAVWVQSGRGRGPHGAGQGFDCDDLQDALADSDQLGALPEREPRGGQFSRAGRHSEARDGAVGNAKSERGWAGSSEGRSQFNRPSVASPSPWGVATWLHGADNRARRVEPSIRLLAHGVPGRVGRLRAYGNAIVPPLAAEVIAAWMDVCP